MLLQTRYLGSLDRLAAIIGNTSHQQTTLPSPTQVQVNGGCCRKQYINYLIINVYCASAGTQIMTHCRFSLYVGSVVVVFVVLCTLYTDYS